MNTVMTLNELIDNALAALETEAQPRQVEPTEAQIVAAAAAMLEAGWRPTDRAAARELSMYLAGPRRHGLMLYGSPGVGKTYFVEAVLQRRAVRARDIVTAYTDEQGYTAAFWHRIFGGWDCEQPDEVVIDDLGEEPECVLYGQREEVLANVVCERYVAWKRSGVRTYVTTNMASADLDKRYGRRVLDRLTEICVVIRIQGGSLRPRSWDGRSAAPGSFRGEVLR